MSEMKVLIVCGTRPEGIKMAPLIHALRADSTIKTIVVNTAQHREMLDQVFKLFKIKTDYDFNLMKPGQTLEAITAEIIVNMRNVLIREKPDVVLVHGDTSTTFAAAYSAFCQKIRIGHVEAGLRTYNIYSPFPEEINRQLTTRIATYHFAPTERNREQLLAECVPAEKIAVVGNTVIDALLYITQQDIKLPKDLFSVLHNGLQTILMTGHRRENLDSLKEICEAVSEILDEFQNVQVVFPVHKNPKVREQVYSAFKQHKRVHLFEPLDYEIFAHIMKKSHIIITDSGGIQEEAPVFGKPVLVTRETTERPEGVEAGTLKIVGTSPETLIKELRILLENQDTYNKMAQAQNPYGDGTTSQQIIQLLKEKINLSIK
ncbi:non-hydrolyzing UDP-N-acetylglucosamine 2-epimerase [Priestia aryabhattai]|uniref:non-hydrolyzing UDP-N-acetylglucosamine 2-epimerase n=1 Tax=Priestia aryabhattai TaxID=412384 RepID=UPI0027E1511D|nr:UDP-N-acetylglucosamine 2-epimerase (non-hydrolyzing) [Priestia aryabhattai]